MEISLYVCKMKYPVFNFENLRSLVIKKCFTFLTWEKCVQSFSKGIFLNLAVLICLYLQKMCIIQIFTTSTSFRTHNRLFSWPGKYTEIWVSVFLTVEGIIISDPCFQSYKLRNKDPDLDSQSAVYPQGKALRDYIYSNSLLEYTVQKSTVDVLCSTSVLHHYIFTSFLHFIIIIITSFFCFTLFYFLFYWSLYYTATSTTTLL